MWNAAEHKECRSCFYELEIDGTINSPASLIYHF